MLNRLRISKPWQESEAVDGLNNGPKLVPEQLPDLTLRRILVPFNFSDTSALLLRRLVPLAERTGATLHLMNIVHPELPPDRVRHRDSGVSEDKMAEAAQAILNLWRDRIVRGRVPTYTCVRVGRRVEEILSRASALSADLIVMTTRGYAGSSRPFTHSTAEQVTRFAPCPVLTFPERTLHEPSPDYDGYPPSAWKRLLMPIDFSRCASRALKYTTALATENRAKLVLLNIVVNSSFYSGAPTTNGTHDPHRLERISEERLRRWVTAELALPLEFESAIWVGMPAAYAVLLEAKRSEADLIVMPTRHALRTKRFRVGNVRDAILRNACCPVLSIHEGMR